MTPFDIQGFRRVIPDNSLCPIMPRSSVRVNASVETCLVPARMLIPNVNRSYRYSPELYLLRYPEHCLPHECRIKHSLYATMVRVEMNTHTEAPVTLEARIWVGP